MTATADSPTEVIAPARTPSALARAEGVELLGDVHGSGYKDGAALVRRADGQVVQLGPLMYALLESVDGRRTPAELAGTLCEKLGRECDEEHVVRLAQKLAAQGLLAGYEQNAPPRRNPLLALRWKVLVTNPRITSRLTAPFTFLYRPWILWPVVVAFVGVAGWLLFVQGVASATADAFDRPGLLLLVAALAVASAGFHELGHAAACRYGGATPAGMGVGLYLVWPAFYTDVTDAYRLPRRDRLRVDLGGLYFNAVVAVATAAVWLAWRADALLLLIALQLLIMVKNLSPVIRSDGYHILADATGVPDLYAHIGPTLRRLLPGHRHEPSALHGRARLLVTLWVLIVVPVLLSLMIGAILLLPRLLTTAWESGRQIARAMPHESSLHVAAGTLQLVALALPVLGSLLVTQKLVRTLLSKGFAWSNGRPVRRVFVVALAGATCCGAAWAWWPSGQYQPVRPGDRGTLTALPQLAASPRGAIPIATVVPVHLAAGTHLAVSLVPVDGASKAHPAFFIVPGRNGDPPVALISDGSGGSSSTASTAGAASSPTDTTTTPSTTTQPTSGSTTPATATAFPFTLPAKPGPGDSQALAVNTTDGSVKYDIAYSLVTVKNGAPVTNKNSAFALASCNACTTVAVSFQVVLVVGVSNTIVPIDAAGALNYKCPACVTAAVADQIVVTLRDKPSKKLVDELNAELQKLNALPQLGANTTPAAVLAQVTAVQQAIVQELNDSGLLAHPIATSTTSTSTSTSTATTGTAVGATSPTTTATTRTTTTTSTGVSPTSPTTTASTQDTSTDTTSTITQPTTTAATTTGP
jgi:putative peptide zinc metalloprotease protein